MTGIKGAARMSCPLCCSAFAPNMLDSISEMKKQQTAVRPALCLTEIPATLPRLLKRFLSGEALLDSPPVHGRPLSRAYTTASPMPQVESDEKHETVVGETAAHSMSIPSAAGFHETATANTSLPITSDAVKRPTTSAVSGKFLLIYMCNFHVLNHFFLFTYVNSTGIQSRQMQSRGPPRLLQPSSSSSRKRRCS
jgi:hypothetical protein